MSIAETIRRQLAERLAREIPVPYRIGPSKAELRRELAQACANTAKLPFAPDAEADRG